jgi:hypothetical protein
VTTDNSRARIPCPRCHEQCGWCADYRWMHGTLRLPNHSGRKNTHCTVPGFEPEGDDCPLCSGAHVVLAAAPDLLEALENFTAGRDISYPQALEVARAAIAKARGQS